jgi:hypothetical protein
MMNKCREEFEKWREPQEMDLAWWTIWQAAWNARQPEVVGRDDICTAIANWLLKADDKPMPSFVEDLADAILDLLTKGRGGE